MDLIEMSEGVLDQRWLPWLEQQNSREARLLRAEIRGKAGVTWSEVSGLDDPALAAMRRKIMELARGL